jgi:hypothetical protein
MKPDAVQGRLGLIFGMASKRESPIKPFCRTLAGRPRPAHRGIKSQSAMAARDYRDIRAITNRIASFATAGAEKPRARGIEKPQVNRRIKILRSLTMGGRCFACRPSRLLFRRFDPE